MRDRLNGINVNLEYSDVKRFFNDRAKKCEGAPLAVTLQTAELTAAREAKEYDTVFSKLNIKSNSKVLDLGSGLGRWAKWLCDKVFLYEGIDFSKECVKISQKTFNGVTNVRFFCQDLRDLPRFAASEPKKYDLCIMNGVLMYLNDVELRNIIEFLPSIMSDNSQIYVRESISVIDSRLTLRNFYSKELASSYNAIYRADDEYTDLFSKFLGLRGFYLSESDLLLDSTLNPRKETNQKYYIWGRTKKHEN